MTYLSVHEWGCVRVAENGADVFTRTQANALLAAARAHPLAKADGSNILIDLHREIRAQQMVGVIAAPGCSLEILPKIDAGASESDKTIRHRLVRMLDIALGLELDAGQAATLVRQPDTLLDIFIRLFADQLLVEARRGLPRAYLAQEEDLPALRGRLDLKRQFTALAAQPVRLACRYDALLADTPLLRIMKACVMLLRQHARASETIRRLDELRFLLADVSDTPLNALPWSQANIDRRHCRWQTLCRLARLFLQRDWQATHADARALPGITLLFPMNDLFEGYIAALARRALRGTAWALSTQSGGLYCLQDQGGRQYFQTRPDLQIQRGDQIELMIDTKWKRIEGALDDRKHGVSQADLYQMLAYARRYRCPQVMLLYPHHAKLGQDALDAAYRILPDAEETLRVASVDLVQGEQAIGEHLARLVAAPHRPVAGAA